MMHQSKKHIYSQPRAVSDPWRVITQQAGEPWTPQPRDVRPHKDPPALLHARDATGTGFLEPLVTQSWSSFIWAALEDVVQNKEKMADFEKDPS